MLDSIAWCNSVHRQVDEDEPTLKSGMQTVASPVDFNGGGSAVRGVTPSFGQHTREVLHELGYSDSKIDAMIAAAEN
jgi:crotonobetainyl-CoA:carnitine CoA-transferase CaiB-like acyl-CoA transferase